MSFAHIIDDIYLGDVFSSNDQKVLSNVKQIVSLCPNNLNMKI
jgi:hypothetical protein